MSHIRFLLNQSDISVSAPANTPLLDVIRDYRHLTGSKEGCREGDCGACLVLIGEMANNRLIYRPATACLTPIGIAAGRHIVTIEGLSGDTPNPIQQALIEQGGIQCGFCTPGIVVALTSFFLNSPHSDTEAAMDAVAGNLCRCTGYAGIKRAIGQLCKQFDLAHSPLESRLRDCMQWHLLPPYFEHVGEDLATLHKSIMSSPTENQTYSPPALIAGGTDWMLHHSPPLRDAKLQFFPTIDDQHCVYLDGQVCRIAASTTIEQLRTSAVLQNILSNIAEDLQLVCSAPIRQHATLGGNLANASPIADLAVLFLALNAELTMDKNGTQRKLPLREFFPAYKQTALQAGERIVELGFDMTATTSGFSFEKVSKRIHLDIASVNSAMAIHCSDQVVTDVHIAVGGVAASPLYLNASCDYLRHKPLKPETILAAAAIAQTEIEPISDLRGSAEYKRLLFRQLFFAHFLKLFPEQIHWEALHALG